jgi:co-chaperonin GroES (HSP10)
MEIKAAHKRLVCRKIYQEEKKHSFLIIPDTTSHIQVTVLARGSEVDSSIEIGDVVCTGKESGIEFKINDEEFISLDESRILAVWKPKNA